MTLNPDDDLFIACSPRIVRRRLGSLSGHDNMSSGSTQGSNDQLTLPSPGKATFKSCLVLSDNWQNTIES